MNVSQFLPGVYQVDLRVSNSILIVEESGLFPEKLTSIPRMTSVGANLLFPDWNLAQNLLVLS
jgi:hypothetical protein